MVPAVTDGLYDSRFEHDACGVGFVADLSARGGHDVVPRQAQTWGKGRAGDRIGSCALCPAGQRDAASIAT